MSAAPSPVPVPSTSPDAGIADASMHDMLRIMDVASALRRERETAESQLDAATAKQRLRERLLATAAAAGESVTSAEVDAAIDHYFAKQHRYEDPPPSWRRFRAHLWVRRVMLAAAVFLVGVLLVVVVVAGNAATGGPQPRPTPRVEPQPVVTPVPAKVDPVPNPPVPVTRVEPQPVAPPVPKVDPWPEAWAKWERSLAAAQKLATAPDGKAAVQQVVPGAEAAQASQDVDRLRRSQKLLDEVVARLDEEYVVTIVTRPGEKSAFERTYNGKVTGFYAVVEAVAPDGQALPRDVVHTEAKTRNRVTRWAEEIPEDVFERLVADKQKDGVLDEVVFARKVRGTSGPVVEMRDSRGRTLERGRTLTSW
ncbi:MAG: hypothetical protein JNK15_07270 [Planctomycetes bacterium]|nr:hypothetical protein [Planctomycetota bacterium]